MALRAQRRPHRIDDRELSQRADVAVDAALPAYRGGVVESRVYRRLALGTSFMANCRRRERTPGCDSAPTSARGRCSLLLSRRREPGMPEIASIFGTHPDIGPLLEMKAMPATSTVSPGSEFQNFLYAPICQDPDGMTLSVLSALARQDVDPWTEAARLSALPREAATQQITDLLGGLPRRTLACVNCVEVAARLSALLPRSAGAKLSGVLQSPATAPQHPMAFAFNWRFFYLYLCLMLLTNWLVAEFRTPPPSQPASATQAGVATTTPKGDAPSSPLGNTPPSSSH